MHQISCCIIGDVVAVATVLKRNFNENVPNKSLLVPRRCECCVVRYTKNASFIFTPD